MSGSYPVLFGQTQEFYECRRNGTVYPCSVPWHVLEGHDEQARKNHSQTLEHLAERGGLSPLELWCVAHDKSFFEARGSMTEGKAIEWLKTIDGVGWKVP